MTTEQILTDLMRRSSETSKTVDEIVKDWQRGNAPLEFKFVPLLDITMLVDSIRQQVEQEKNDEQSKKPIKKFLFVEDGSVDCNDLMEDLSIKNPEIKVVVYRQGSREPQLKDITE